MLGDKYNLDLNYNDKVKKLYFNFRTIKNLFELTSKNPFKYLEEFIASNENYDYLASILYCLCDGNIQLNDIVSEILNDDENATVLTNNLIFLIKAELTAELNEDVKKDDKEKSDEDDDSINAFIQYWNYFYYIATVQLKMTEVEFYNCSVRELKTLSKLHTNFIKNSLIDTYITVVKAQNEAKENNASESHQVEDTKQVKRFIDLF